MTSLMLAAASTDSFTVTTADLGGRGVVGANVLRAGVFVERVLDSEVAVGDDGTTDLTLDTVVSTDWWMISSSTRSNCLSSPSMSHSQRGICSVAGDPGLKTLAATCQKSVSQIAKTETPHRRRDATSASSSVQYAVDMHVKILDERVASRAKARGIDVLVYAPHFERLPDIRAKAAEFTDDELLVVPAREVFTGTWRQRRHLLAIGLEDPIPDFITFDGGCGN